MLSETELDLIQKYLDNSLSEDERTQFDTLLDTSEAFANEVRFQKNLLNHLKADQKAERKAAMLSDFRQIQDASGFEKTINYNIIWYSAAAIILLAFSYFTWFYQGSSDREEVFLSYYQPYSGFVISRGEDSSYHEGIRAYGKGDYEQALSYLLAIEKTDSTGPQLSLLIGNCYLSLNKTEKSIQWFNEITDQENLLMVSNRDWYTALALLRSGDTKSARDILQKIIDVESYYSAEAKAIIGEAVFR